MPSSGHSLPPVFQRFRALVMLDGGHIDPPGDASETLADVRAYWLKQPGFRFASWEETFDEARTYFSRWSPELERAVRRGLREEDGEIVSIASPELFATVQWWLRQEPPTSILPTLGRTSVPVLFLIATEPPERAREHADRVTRFAELVPHAVVEPVAGASHFLLEDRPVEVASSIGHWLRSL